MLVSNTQQIYVLTLIQLKAEDKGRFCISARVAGFYLSCLMLMWYERPGFANFLT